MLPLCEALSISVNEILSGEELHNSYMEKAEINLLGLIKKNEKDKLNIKMISLWQIISLLCSFVIWFLLFVDSNIYNLGHIPTPLTLCYLIVGFISIYVVIITCIYGIIKKDFLFIFTSLSFASLTCLVICIAYNTFWLMIPSVIGIIICFFLSLWQFYKKKHKHIN